ncbi:aldo/keto reductase [bacterium]|nr:aldo/keto reductase [bacterium]
MQYTQIHLPVSIGTIQRALELGINHIETARGYGTSEAQLAPVLQNIPRNQFILQTKVSPQADPAEFEKIFRTSLSRLGLPFVDLFSLHGINNREILDWSLRPGGCLVDYVNLHWYYIFQEHTPSLAAAKKNDMGVFIISPNDKGGMLYTAPKKLVDLTQPLTPMAFNALFCLRNQDIHTLSIGAARPSDFDEHVAAITCLPEAETLLPPIEEKLRTQWETALPDRWRKSWDSGLPSWPDAPQEANFREILRLYNLAIAFDLTDYGRMRYNLLGQGGHWFAGQPLGNITREEILPSLRKCPDPQDTLNRLFSAKDLFSGEKVQRLSSC